MAILPGSAPPGVQVGQSQPSYAIQNPLLSDPEVQWAMTMMAYDLAKFEAEVARLKKEALIEYGDPDLAAKVLGEPREAGEKSSARVFAEPLFDTLFGQYVAPVKEGMPTKEKPKEFATTGEAQNYILQQMVNGMGHRYRWRIQALRPQSATVRAALDNPYSRLARPQKTKDLEIQDLLPQKFEMGATVKAALDNPYSTLAQLQKTKDLEIQNLREQLNRANLWYSSYRGQQEAELAWEHGRREHEAAEAINKYIADLDRQLANLKEAQQLQRQQILKGRALARTGDTQTIGAQ